jgi:hypothetical protein
VDLSKLTTADKVIAGAGIVLFISSFLAWFKVEAFGYSATANGWDVGFFWGGIPALLGLAAAIVVLVNKLTDADLPDLPVPWSQALFGAGALSAVIVVLKLLTGYHSVDRAFGLFLATLAALAFAAGGFLKMQEGDDGSTATGGTGSAPF